MKELVNLLYRAAAGFETPQDLSEEDKEALISDLLIAAKRLARVFDDEE